MTLRLKASAVRRAANEAIEAPAGDWGFSWPLDLIEGYANLIMGAGGSYTALDYVKTELELPGFMDDVYLYIRLARKEEQSAQKALQQSRNNPVNRAGGG